MLVRLPDSCARLLALAQAGCLAGLVLSTSVALGQGYQGQGYQGRGYSMSPEMMRPLTPQPTAPQPTATPGGPRQIVADVQVIGNKATKDHEVFKYIQTRRDREFDSEQLQGDARRLLQTGLFRDVKTYTRATPGGVVVTFEVFERPRINYLRHLGNRGLSEKKLLTEHGLKVGDPLVTFSSEEARRKIEELYHKSGYPNATVSLVEGNKKEDQGVVFFINEGQLERISKVEIVGNTISSEARLETQIESKPGFLWYFFRGKLDREKIDADVQKLTAYYRSLGFFRARVGRELLFDETGKWVTLRFTIDEGPRYVVRNVTVEGNEKFASRPLLGFLDLKSGQHFNQAKMNKDLNTIVDLYGSQGHVFADVQADPRFLDEPGTLDLVYRIKEGEVFRVGDINVNIGGEFPHTRQTVVLNRLAMAYGDLMDTRKIRDAERRLKASQLVEVDPQQGDPPRVVVRPPDLSAVGRLAEQPKPPGTIRGQSPDGPLPRTYSRQPQRPIEIKSWEQLR
jgi:outer membrane protein insertion porin family